MRFRGRGSQPDVPVRPGERLLTATETDAGPVGATVEALYLPDGTRLGWDQVENAEWDSEAATLRVSEIGTFGATRPVHELGVAEPGHLLEVVRERVTASVVLQRHVTVSGGGGLRVVARRSPTGAREVSWFFEYDEGVDPDDPDVRRMAEAALAAARSEVGAD